MGVVAVGFVRRLAADAEKGRACRGHGLAAPHQDGVNAFQLDRSIGQGGLRLFFISGSGFIELDGEKEKSDTGPHQRRHTEITLRNARCWRAGFPPKNTTADQPAGSPAAVSLARLFNQLKFTVNR